MYVSACLHISPKWACFGLFEEIFQRKNILVEILFNCPKNKVKGIKQNIEFLKAIIFFKKVSLSDCYER